MSLHIESSSKRQVIDITGDIADMVGHKTKLVHVFVKHSTAAIAIADLDPGGTDLDYLQAFQQMIPDIKYRHPHDPEHMQDHVLATIIGPEVTIPVNKGQLSLGTWQRIALFEFDGPKNREVFVTLS